MSLGIKWGDPQKTDEPSGFIYLDAVTAYSQDYRGQVTKHPVDSGASITDHFVKENPIFTISGVVSGTDLSGIPWTITDQEGNKPINAQEQPVSISLNSSASGLLQYLPDSIGQFLSLSTPSVEVFGNTRTDLTYEIVVKDLLKDVLSGIKYNPTKDKVESHIQIIDLYEFDKSNIRDIISDLVITSFRIREDQDTGDALFLDLTLEQVTFATLEKVEIPQDVQDGLKKKVVPKKKKTNAPSTPKDCAAAQEAGDSTAPATSADDLSILQKSGASIIEGVLGE
jgi:hypothetical protein